MKDKIMGIEIDYEDDEEQDDEDDTNDDVELPEEE